MKHRLAGIVILVLLAAVGIRAFSDPVSMERLQRLRKGMTQSEVREILGEPTKRYETGQWTYKRPLVFGFVNIHWQADGTFDGEVNYEQF